MIVARGIGRGAYRGPIVSVGYGRRVVVPVIIPPIIPDRGRSGGGSFQRKEELVPLAITGVATFVQEPAQLFARGRVIPKVRPLVPPTPIIPQFTIPKVAVKPVSVAFVGSAKIIAQQEPQVVAVGDVNTDEVDAILLLMSLDL